ncbi:MAG: hypothetical protein V1704_01360 [Candidatus Vogelbacteria bacterium]
MTRAFRLLIRQTPVARISVTTIGRPSGMTETASEMTVVNISLTGLPKSTPVVNKKRLIPTTTKIMIRDKSRMFVLSGISVSILAICLAILPIMVFTPVSTTIARPLPETTWVLFQIIFFWSAISRLGPSRMSATLCRGSDSPVREASSTLRLLATRIRASAGMRSPS